MKLLLDTQLLIWDADVIWDADEFERLSSSTVEGFTLLTADPLVARYPGPIQKV